MIDLFRPIAQAIPFYTIGWFVFHPQCIGMIPAATMLKPDVIDFGPALPVVCQGADLALACHANGTRHELQHPNCVLLYQPGFFELGLFDDECRTGLHHGCNHRNTQANTHQTFD